MNVGEVLSRLHHVKQAGQGKWMAFCPVHEADGNQHQASLSISVGEAGRVLLHCHAGCPTADVLRALGLQESDLFPAHAQPDQSSAKPEITATYDYLDASGSLLYQVVRYEPKSFRQRRPDGNGGWLWNINGVPRVLYRLPELLAADPAQWVFVVEGEKDVESLASIGVTATCNPGGAGKWGRLSDDSALAGRRVCIIADKDAAGRSHAADVARRLYGKAAMVKVIELPGEGIKDATDWAESRDAAADDTLVGELLDLAEIAPIWTPPAEEQAEAPAPKPRHSPVSPRRLREAFPHLREPVIDGLLRRGELMNVIAPPKAGKSWFVLDLALSVATGRPWLEFDTTPGRVLVLDNELHPPTLSHRLDKVADAREIPREDYDDCDRVFLDTCRGKGLDLFALRDYFAGVPADFYTLVIIDAFYRFLPTGIDENSNADLTALYNELDTLADRLHCCLVLVHHSTKGSQSQKSIVDVGAGAGAMSRATDTHLILRAHEEENVVVLEAAVRSFPPVNPVCLRWTFPVWQVEPELDPAKLSEGRRKKPDKPADEAKAKGAPITPEKFVEAFLSTEPKAKDLIILDAANAGVAERKARMLLAAVESKGLAYPWEYGSDRRRKLSYATRPQPRLVPDIEPEKENINTHTPPVPPESA